MSENVVSFPGNWEQPLKWDAKDKCAPADSLNCALDHDLDCVGVCGLNKDGTIFAASSLNHTPDTLLMIDRVRRLLMQRFDGDEFG